MVRYPVRALLPLLLLPLLAAGQNEPRPKVLLIGLDGVRVDIMQAASTPNIDAM